MKRIITITLMVGILLTLTGCSHEHIFNPATCTEPAKCQKCKATEGEPLGHKWEAATCTEPSTCSVCGYTEGEPLGHKWEAATCTVPETCSVCGETNGDVLEHTWIEADCEKARHCSVCGAFTGKSLGHTWEDATCTTPKICTVCGKSSGIALGHTTEETTVVKEATCTEKGLETGICTVCGETFEITTEILPHTPSEAEVSSITCENGNFSGVKTTVCAMCGEELESKKVYLSFDEKKQWLKENCKETYSYNEIARNPQTYKGKYAYYKGEVIQVMPDSSGEDTLRVSITKGRYFYDDPILVLYFRGANGTRLLEGDIVTIYGQLMGEYTYTSTMNQEITVPLFYAYYAELK